MNKQTNKQKIKKTDQTSSGCFLRINKSRNKIITMIKWQCLLPLLLSHFLVNVSSQNNGNSELWREGEPNCVQGLRQYNPLTQKQIYHVGVHASAGVESARREFNLTFQEYLNEAVGKRWDPPIEFKMKITDDSIQDWLDKKEDVDFMYTDTGIYSCIGVEIGAKPIATTAARLISRGRDYDLDIFAGTMMVLADNDDINSIEDLKGKVIGAQAFSDFAGAQAQIYVMHKEGINPLIDAKQVIFTGKNERVFSFLNTCHIENIPCTNDCSIHACLQETTKILCKVYLTDDGMSGLFEPDNWKEPSIHPLVNQLIQVL